MHVSKCLIGKGTTTTSASCSGRWQHGCQSCVHISKCASWHRTGQGPVRDCALVQAAIGCCILLLLVHKMVLTLSNLHWWCLSCHQLVQRPHLHLQVSTCMQLALVVFYLCQLAHLLMCTHDWQPCCHRPLQLALVVVFPLPTKYLLMNTHAHEHILQLTLCGGGGCTVCGGDFM